MRTARETVDKNYAAATAAVSYLRDILAAEVTAGATVNSLTVSLNKVAEAEGSRDFWARMKQAADFDRGEPFTEATAMRVALSILGRGADDSWSGRGNDTKRAYFDGVCAASHKVEDMFW